MKKIAIYKPIHAGKKCQECGEYGIVCLIDEKENKIVGKKCQYNECQYFILF